MQTKKILFNEKEINELNKVMQDITQGLLAPKPIGISAACFKQIELISHLTGFPEKELHKIIHQTNAETDTGEVYVCADITSPAELMRRYPDMPQSLAQALCGHILIGAASPWIRLPYPHLVWATESSWITPAVPTIGLAIAIVSGGRSWSAPSAPYATDAALGAHTLLASFHIGKTPRSSFIQYLSGESAEDQLLCRAIATDIFARDDEDLFTLFFQKNPAVLLKRFIERLSLILANDPQV